MLVLYANLVVLAKALAEGERGNQTVVPGRGNVVALNILELRTHQGNGCDAKEALIELLLVGQL